jgi:hypothetical protein
MITLSSISVLSPFISEELSFFEELLFGFAILASQLFSAGGVVLGSIAERRG